MKRSASKVIRELENRIANLEKEASVQATMQGFDDGDEPLTREVKVKATTSQTRILGMVAKTMGCPNAQFKDEGLTFNKNQMNIEIWCGENSNGLDYVIYTINTPKYGAEVSDFLKP